MQKSKRLLRLVFLAMMIALGVVISPILRVEGMCPMAHFINVTCSVLLGPWYSLLCAAVIGVIRMAVMAIPPLALTGAVFGAFLSGVFYRASRGSLLLAVLGEVIGTGIIGAIASWPVMSLLWGKEGLTWLFYVPSFVCGALIGGAVAFLFLKKLSKNGLLVKFQSTLGSHTYRETENALSDALVMASLGAVSFVVIEAGADLLQLDSPAVGWAAKGSVLLFGMVGLSYYLKKRTRRHS